MTDETSARSSNSNRSSNDPSAGSAERVRTERTGAAGDTEAAGPQVGAGAVRTSKPNLGPGTLLPCGCYLRPDDAEPRFWFCNQHGAGHADSTVVAALLRAAPEEAVAEIERLHELRQVELNGYECMVEELARTQKEVKRLRALLEFADDEATKLAYKAAGLADESKPTPDETNAGVLPDVRLIRSALFQQFMRQGFWHAHHVDLVWRMDGKDVREEADWLKDVWYALRPAPKANPPPPTPWPGANPNKSAPDRCPAREMTGDRCIEHEGHNSPHRFA